MIVPLIIFWTCAGISMWLAGRSARSIYRSERRHAALAQQQAILRSIYKARANGDVQSATLHLDRFFEHDEAMLKEFPELRAK